MRDIIDNILQEINYRENPYFVSIRERSFAKDDFVETQIQFFMAVIFFSRPMAALAAKMGNLDFNGVLKDCLLPALRQLPIDSLDLKEAGWANYLSLEPQEISRVLEIALQHAAEATSAAEGSPRTSTLEGLSEMSPSVASAIRAIAIHCPLHRYSRHILHSWLVESGNLLVWKLLQHLLVEARQYQQVVAHVPSAQLPQGLSELYPIGLHRAAEVVLRCYDREPAGAPCARKRVLYRLEADDVDVDNALSLIREALQHGNNDGLSNADAWHLALDGISLLRCCLREVPWDALDRIGVGHGVGVRMNAKSCPTAAAGWLALLMWPHNPNRLSILVDFLRLKWDAVDVESVAPWVDTLQVWRQNWLNSCPQAQSSGAPGSPEQILIAQTSQN